LNTSKKLALTSSTLGKFAFNVFLSKQKPVYSILVAVFDAGKTFLGGSSNMGTYRANQIIEKHDDKWSYKTYEMEVTTGSGKREWVKPLKVEQREIGYRQEYKLWNTKTNVYTYVYANYGTIESFVPEYYTYQNKAVDYIKKNCSVVFTKEIYHNGKTNKYGEKVKTSHREYIYRLNNPEVFVSLKR